MTIKRLHQQENLQNQLLSTQISLCKPLNRQSHRSNKPWLISQSTQNVNLMSITLLFIKKPSIDEVSWIPYHVKFDYDEGLRNPILIEMGSGRCVKTANYLHDYGHLFYNTLSYLIQICFKVFKVGLHCLGIRIEIGVMSVTLIAIINHNCWKGKLSIDQRKER